MIVIDECHIHGITINTILKCYEYAKKNQVLVYHFGSPDLYKVIKTGCYENTYWHKERFQSVIANPEVLSNIITTNRNPLPYELFDYQKEAYQKMLKNRKHLT